SSWSSGSPPSASSRPRSSSGAQARSPRSIAGPSSRGHNVNGRLALIVATPPARGDFERAERLARAARGRGLEVDGFLMSDAAGWAADARAAALVEDGCEVVVCSTNFGDRPAAAGVLVGSQDDHARMVGRADRVLAFT